MSSDFRLGFWRMSKFSPFFVIILNFNHTCKCRCFTWLELFGIILICVCFDYRRFDSIWSVGLLKFVQVIFSPIFILRSQKHLFCYFLFTRTSSMIFLFIFVYNFFWVTPYYCWWFYVLIVCVFWRRIWEVNVLYALNLIYFMFGSFKFNRRKWACLLETCNNHSVKMPNDQDRGNG